MTFDYIEEKKICMCNNWIRSISFISNSQSNICFDLKDIFIDNPVPIELKYKSLRLGYTNYVCSLLTCNNYQPALKVYTELKKGEIFFTPNTNHSYYNKTYVRALKIGDSPIKAGCISLRKKFFNDSNTIKLKFNERIEKIGKFQPIILNFSEYKGIVIFSILSFIFIVIIAAFMFLTRENRIGFRLFTVRVYPNVNIKGKN